MSGQIRCFLIEKSGRERVSLRRYRSGDEKCSVAPGGYHDAMTHVADVETVGDVVRTSTDYAPPEGEFPADDARWPRSCPCGLVFQRNDPWQVFRESLYRGQHPQHGEIEVTLRSAPAGALWRAPWFEGVPSWRGPDGRSYCVKTPGGEWFIDGVARVGGNVSNQRWERTGEAPCFTVKPSILFDGGHGAPGYHAFLTEGVLIPC